MTTKTIKQLWEEHAASIGKGAEYLAARVASFPPNYTYALNWTVVPTIQPKVVDQDKTGLENEHWFYKELIKLFIKNVDATIERIKRSDRAQASRITVLVKRLQQEAPSSELLGLYAAYQPIVSSALDAAEASKATAEELNSETDAKLRELSKLYYKVMYAGKAGLYSVKDDEMTTYTDCREHFAALKVQVVNPDTGKFQTRNVFDVFKEWDKAPRYDRVVFNPRRDGHYEENFNLWQGFCVAPEAGEDDLMLWDLLDRICDGNEQYFNYVQNWLAHMVQKPWELPGTALGIQGKQGIGKNAFVETVGMLLSSPQMVRLMQNQEGDGLIGKILSTGSYGYFKSYEEVFGTFNMTTASKLLLFLDEATWGGGHVQKSGLKTAITGKTVIINDKHMKHLSLYLCVKRSVLLWRRRRRQTIAAA